MAQWRRVHDAAGVGGAIATLRRTHGLTQGELSEWLGVDRSTVVRLEAGNAAQLRRLMDALSVLGADLVVLERTAHVSVTDEIGAKPDTSVEESLPDTLSGHGSAASSDHPSPATTS